MEVAGTRAAKEDFQASGYEQAADAALDFLGWGWTSACDPHALGTISAVSAWSRPPCV